MEASSQPPSEAILGGRYELVEPVGEGNFSVTYRARDLVLGRTVAVKILRPQYAADQSFVARFEREARIAASVSHPNVVDVYDYGPHRDTFYIVMQYVPGRTLKQELEARGRLDPPEAVRIAGQLLRGLAAIHAAGIVHRDIKPQNVLLGRDGVARVTDFGVAHYPVHGSLTSHGTTVGTASYMAPEQARGGALSQATDLYAVGVVLYELLTGRLPFEADNPMAVMLAHLQQQPPAPRVAAPDVTMAPALEAQLMRALAKNPAERHPSAEDMARALEAALGPTLMAPSAVSTPPSVTATIPLAPSREPAAGAPARPVTAQGQTTPMPAAVPTGPPPQPAAMLPSVRKGRRPVGWLAPLLVFALAILALGGLVASEKGFPGRGEQSRDPQTVLPVAAVDETATPSPSPVPDAVATVPATATRVAIRAAPPATATSTPTPSPISLPSPTATIRAALAATATPQPTRTPLPTVTPEPVPTSTPEPTATPEPEPTPTVTPEPVVPDTSADDAVSGALPEPPADIEPIDGDDDSARRGRQNTGEVLTFDASDWRGAFMGDQSWYGRPWVAVYGRESPYPRATLRFDLPESPSGPMVLTLTGLGDETGEPFPFGIEVNGVFAGESTVPFPNWDPAAHGAQGERAPWSQVQVSIPGDLLRQGGNQISVVSRKSGQNWGGPPYLLLSDAVLTPAGEASLSGGADAASAGLESIRLDSRGKPKEGPGQKSGKSDPGEKSGSSHEGRD